MLGGVVGELEVGHFCRLHVISSLRLELEQEWRLDHRSSGLRLDLHFPTLLALLAWVVEAASAGLALPPRPEPTVLGLPLLTLEAFLES